MKSAEETFIAPTRSGTFTVTYEGVTSPPITCSEREAITGMEMEFDKDRKLVGVKLVKSSEA